MNSQLTLYSFCWLFFLKRKVTLPIYRTRQQLLNFFCKLILLFPRHLTQFVTPAFCLSDFSMSHVSRIYCLSVSCASCVGFRRIGKRGKFENTKFITPIFSRSFLRSRPREKERERENRKVVKPKNQPKYFQFEPSTD